MPVPQVSLEAVPGRLCPVPGVRGAFYGRKRAPAGAADEAIVHRVPDGSAYVSAGPFAVDAREDGMPRDPYVRRALLRGDLRSFTAPSPAREE